MEGKLPPHMNIQLVPISPEGPLDHENVEKIDFLIASGIEYPPKRMKEIFDTAKQLKVKPLLIRITPSIYQPKADGLTVALQVVQTMSAGVNAIQHMVPEGVMLCNASGCHDIAVAEWCALAVPHAPTHPCMRQLAPTDGLGMQLPQVHGGDAGAAAATAGLLDAAAGGRVGARHAPDHPVAAAGRRHHGRPRGAPCWQRL